MIRKSAILGCILVFAVLPVVAQFSVEVKKMPLPEKEGRYYLDVRVTKNGKMLDSIYRQYYSYDEMYQQGDSLGLIIAGKLVKFLSDTSLCGKPVKAYGNDDYPGCYNVKPHSERFTIGMEAMFIINRVVYSPLTFRLGCYPVLFDEVTGKELNDNHRQIQSVAERYKQWYKEFKSRKKAPDYEMLKKGQIKWWGTGRIAPAPL
ncbi:hypothetical protein [Chitinophaga barathri]|uniref:Uncharacterized protein n=1 Tax=Chitinophaga barathri TaxID=1647451 RepID=A0A3N4M7Z0_9BACT|nr:hypothetical protein [Chitinophaga barathri]RPD39491.1 hypothetical protein EG028_20450 [Chitinophaga barathri]